MKPFSEIREKSSQIKCIPFCLRDEENRRLSSWLDKEIK